jgi:DNA processing protein
VGLDGAGDHTEGTVESVNVSAAGDDTGTVAHPSPEVLAIPTRPALPRQPTCDTEEIRLARAALGWLVEPGNRDVYEMVSQDGPVATLRRLLTGDVPAGKLRDVTQARLRHGDPRRLVTGALIRARRLDARIVIAEDEEWPAQLQDLTRISCVDARRRADRDTLPPLCLWVRGQGSLAEACERSVAIVGARMATSYGVHVATNLGYELAEQGWTVVSGGAYGIDAAAHRGALTASGMTVAVLACGVDKPYPVSHTNLFERIAEHGLLVSEWPPGAAPFRHRFLIRNRVIAAVTRGTVMVEAATRCDAKQTLGRALLLGRPAMVIPGPVTSEMSGGCHEALREHPRCRLVTSSAEVVQEVEGCRGGTGL